MWFPFALSFALITSISVVIAKKVMSEMNEYLYLWITGIFTIPFLLFLIIIFFQIPKFDNIFLINTLASITINIFASILAYKAIRISEISLISPISAFNPVFTAVISYVTLGEQIGVRGGVGIMLICLGAYLLQLSKSSKGILKPIEALFTNKGVQFSLIAYFLWAIAPTFQKIAILHTTPQVPPFTSLVGLVGTTFAYTFLFNKFPKNSVKLTKKYVKLLLIIGILAAVGQVAAMIAFSLTQLGFATAIFKLSIIFSVILGWLFFKEHDIKERLLGSLTMLIGVILLIK